MLELHRGKGGDLTVATLSRCRAPRPAPSAASRWTPKGWVIGFVEKPANPPPIPGQPDHSLVSMGNYIFRTGALLEELRRNAAAESTTHDFGKDILTTAHERMRVAAYDFATQLCPGESENSRGYWRDVGNARRLLRGEHGSRLRRAAPQPLQRGLADPRHLAARRSREVRVLRRAAAGAWGPRAIRSSARARSSRAARSSRPCASATCA